MPTAAEHYYEHNTHAMKPVRDAVPELLKGFGGLHHTAMKDGALDTRAKELIALGIGIAVRCSGGHQSGCDRRASPGSRRSGGDDGWRSGLHLPAASRGGDRSAEGPGRDGVTVCGINHQSLYAKGTSMYKR